MEVKIKYENISTLCQGCLSVDRKLKEISEQYKSLYYKIRGDLQINSNNELNLCWECAGTLRKLHIYQTRIKAAQQQLLQYLETVYYKNGIPQSLSRFKMAYQTDYYDYDINYEETQQNQNQFTNNDEKITIEPTILNKIKQEFNDNDNSDIKEEYFNDDDDFTNNDADYNELDLKIEMDIKKKINVKKKDGSNKNCNDKPYSIHKYEKYVTVTKRLTNLTDKCEDYYENVCYRYMDYELYLNERDRKSCSYNRMPYKCNECMIGYKRRFDFLRHNSLLHDKTPLPHPCTACKDIIYSTSELDAHWSEVHTKMYKCTVCSEMCRSLGEINKHLNRVHSKVYTCNGCRSEFSTLRDFSSHYQKVHEKLICDHCARACTTKKMLERHMRRAHLPAHCDQCDRRFTNHRQYEKHARTYHPEVMHCDVRKELSYCVECDKQFESMYRYKRHLQQSVKHRPQKKIKVPCPACDKIFTRKNYMNNHYKLVHMNNSKYYCDLCNKYFSNGFGLRTHIAHVHEKRRLPKDKMCDLCGRGFSTNRILLNHRRTHTGERPFSCPYCAASFAQQTAMKTHVKTQHKHQLTQ